MKINLPDEQFKNLIQKKVDVQIAETTKQLRKDLLKVKKQLDTSLKLTNDVMLKYKMNPKKTLNDADFIKLFSDGKTNIEIAKELNYSPSYISDKKRKLIKEKKLIITLK